MQREFPKVSPVSREQKGLIFGGLVADGFLIVEAERKSAVDNLGRVLMREARGLGVADQVIRHSASLTEFGHRGAWEAVRKKLIATQADVEQAMIEQRDQKMAHLISLGGWFNYDFLAHDLYCLCQKSETLAISESMIDNCQARGN